ncbi:hypothetical protein BDV25DRAFT_164801, partial [Aspergillus avenaceus]
MSGPSHSARLSKRSRPSDAAQDNMTLSKDERIKRRRTSRINANKLEGDSESTEHSSAAPMANGPPYTRDPKKPSGPVSWMLSAPVAGRYINVDPILTDDEKYLFVGLETAVHVYSVATSCLLRTLQLSANQSVIGFGISRANQEHLFIFTSTGAVSKWHWLTGKQVSHWETGHKVISVSQYLQAYESSGELTLLALRECKNGKREVAVIPLGEEELHQTVILETSVRLEHIKCTLDGTAVIAYGAHRVYIGTENLDQDDPGSLQFTWRDISSPFNMTSLDIRHSPRTAVQNSGNEKGSADIEVTMGGSDGSILICHDILSCLDNGEQFEGGRNHFFRRLHWHRDPVNVVRWSKDGNYLVSGGHESVMVLWQLDTGRKQFLPHLSSPICNIVVSQSGNSYVVKLADNSIIVLSTRELQPFANITGLQTCPQVGKSKPGTHMLPTPRAAKLHPRHPDRLLICVPASRQVTREGLHLANSCVLQTYDIRSDNHISRQALSRTNTTTLKVGPEGSLVVAPTVTHLDVSWDGKWMATVDSWSPYSYDVEALDPNGARANASFADSQEIYMKFWRYDDPSGLWELVTRVDGPHFMDKGPVSVLDLASRPLSHEFATIGCDAVVRLWCLSSRHRSGLSAERDAESLETWKCRNTVDLKGYIAGDMSSYLTTASMAFSQDGSVLAVCLQPALFANQGTTVLVDVRNCTVRYSRVGLHVGELCAVRFSGCHLIIASKQSLTVWDTVGDIVRTPGFLEEAGCAYSDRAQRLLAVDPNTQSFAVATQQSHNLGTSRKRKCRIHVYDVQSLSLLGQFSLQECALALLSDSQSGDYIIVDTSANVRRVSCNNKSRVTQVQKALELNSDMLRLFGSQPLGSKYNNFSQELTMGNNIDTTSLQNRELAGIFC